MADVEAEDDAAGDHVARAVLHLELPDGRDGAVVARATASTALTNSAAAHRASRRSAIGTVPA